MVFFFFFFRLALNLSCLCLQDEVNKLDQIYLESVCVCVSVVSRMSNLAEYLPILENSCTKVEMKEITFLSEQTARQREVENASCASNKPDMS